MEQPQKSILPRDRLIEAGTALFSQHGFAAATVREICGLADVGGNMVHHYFGNKQGLFDEIMSGFTEDVWQVPMRIISAPAESRQNLISRLEIFFEETFEALVSHRRLYEMAVREKMIFEVFTSYTTQFVRYIEAAKQAGFVREALDIEMLTGFVLDRLGNQILFASWIEKTSGHNVLTDRDYRRRWLKANLDFVFHGMLTCRTESP
ncbi:MAG: TetR/AcrR family transcriptional regulator [Alphaproteobacteria bacterium]|nr:TetR/AcrR family transcriptional regulator [Alphaproteobacteria bacterium]